LEVSPAHVLDLPLVGDPAQVACSVHAAARPAGEGVGQETGGRQARLADISASQSFAADEQLADLPQLARPQMLVKDPHAHAVNWFPDADRFAGPADRVRRLDRGLGGSVHVADPRGCAATGCVKHRKRQGLSSDKQQPQRPAAGQTGRLAEKREPGRHHAEDRDAVAAHLPDYAIRVATQILVREDDRRPAQQWLKELEDRSVEDIVECHQRPVRDIEREGSLAPPQGIADGLVRNHHPLR
jgi:hypothetical protein